jgi:hypothetical protein
MPKATSVLYTVRSLGNTVGIAISASIQQGKYVKAVVVTARKLTYDRSVAVLVKNLREVLYTRADREKASSGASPKRTTC